MCESMHGGVRGRGSNPPTYSIVQIEPLPESFQNRFGLFSLLQHVQHKETGLVHAEAVSRERIEYKTGLADGDVFSDLHGVSVMVIRDKYRK